MVRREDEWCGARPVTVDGLPLIGATRLPHLFVAGGHGTWGMTEGPASGELLAHYIATGERPTALNPFDRAEPPGGTSRRGTCAAPAGGSCS